MQKNERRSYASDLSERQRVVIEPLFPRAGNRSKNEQFAGLRPIGVNCCVRCAVLAHIDMGLNAGISALRIFLIHQPDIALLILDPLLIQPFVHFAGRPAVILTAQRNWEQVLAGEHNIIIVSFQL